MHMFYYYKRKDGRMKKEAMGIFNNPIGQPIL